MKKLKTTQKEYLTLSPFIREYEWKNIDFPTTAKDWKRFEEENKAIAFNILFVPYK